MEILRQSDAPAHLFNIPELDFSETLFAERLNHPWVRLGALSVSRANRRGPEWPHWRQYAVEPPDAAGFAALRSETKIPEAVNGVLDALQRLNAAFLALCNSAGVLPTTDLWQGSRDGLAARQLKWVYRIGADDDEFLKRATLASTLFLDGLTGPPVREFLSSLGERLHQSFDKAGNTLGSRKPSDDQWVP